MAPKNCSVLLILQHNYKGYLKSAFASAGGWISIYCRSSDKKN